MTPDEAVGKAAQMLDRAAEGALDSAYVSNCVAIADAWTRLYGALVTGAMMRDSH